MIYRPLDVFGIGVRREYHVARVDGHNNKKTARPLIVRLICGA